MALNVRQLMTVFVIFVAEIDVRACTYSNCYVCLPTVNGHHGWIQSNNIGLCTCRYCTWAISVDVLSPASAECCSSHLFVVRWCLQWDRTRRQHFASFAD